MTQYSTFRKAVWDPVLIVAQIVTLQCFGYGAFSVLMVGASILTDMQLTPRLLFSSQTVQNTVEGYVVTSALLAMGAANIVPLVYMVERSRLCVDFSLTFFAVHVVLVWWSQGEAPHVLWWAAVAASAGVMAVGGRAACMRREMLPIAIRSFMPERPSEQLGDADLGAEEHELETRVAEPDSRVAEPDSRVAEPAAAARSSSGGWSDDWGVDEEPMDQAPMDKPKGHKDD